jgi:hypothetical protein
MLGITQAELADLRQKVRGPVLEAGDAEYENVYRVWNGMMDERRPGLIVRCTGPADVSAAVRFCRDHDLYPAVRGGGHSAAGTGTCHKGLLIDLSCMRGVRVDPTARTTTAQGGALWGDYDHETQAFGLGSPGGAVSTTGVAGLTLGGGIGWLTRKFGLACDSLIGADLVTSDGNLIQVSQESDPDLMWALKGGGGNFGIATALHFRVHPVGPIVLGGPIIYAMEHAAEVFALVSRMSQEAPDDLGIGLIICPIKPTPMFPEELHWRPVVIVLLCWSGDLKAGERVIAPFRQIAPPIMDYVAPIQYANLQKNYDSLVPKGRRSYWKSGYLKSMNTEVAKRFIKYGAQPHSPYSQVEAVVLGGQFGRTDEDASAFGDRSGVAVYNVECFWLDAKHDSANIEWARSAFRDLEQFSTGTAYVNFLSEEGDERVRASYSASYKRLSQVKARVDPDNVFRINHNILPASVPRVSETGNV